MEEEEAERKKKLVDDKIEAGKDTMKWKETDELTKLYNVHMKTASYYRRLTELAERANENIRKKREKEAQQMIKQWKEQHAPPKKGAKKKLLI